MIVECSQTAGFSLIGSEIQYLEMKEMNYLYLSDLLSFINTCVNGTIKYN